MTEAEEGAAILAEIEAMSQQNVAAFGWEESRFTPDSLPACDALRRILRADVDPREWWMYGERRERLDCVERLFYRCFDDLRCEDVQAALALGHAERSRHWVARRAAVAERSDGDSPASLDGTDSVSLPEYRNWYREPDRRALTMREWCLDRGRGDGYAAGVRYTHREVHRALAGDETDGGTIAGCRFCAGAPK